MEASMLLIVEEYTHVNVPLSRTEFIKRYQLSGQSLTDVELDKLQRFCNMVSIAFQFIKPHYCRDHIIDLATRVLEGKYVKYCRAPALAKPKLLKTGSTSSKNW